MPRAKANPDITIRQFRNTCHDEGFAWLGGTAQKFVDLRFPVWGRYILPERNDRGQILHAETLTALRASRAASEQEKARAEAERARQVSLAEKLAPQVVPPPRDTLANAEAISVMADDMRHANASAGGVRRSDLMLVGWTRAQLDRYGEQARLTAYRLEAAIG